MTQDIQSEVQQLLDQAMARPGVAELMQIYEAHRPAMEAVTEAQASIAPRWTSVYSTSSATQGR